MSTQLYISEEAIKLALFYIRETKTILSKASQEIWATLHGAKINEAVLFFQRLWDNRLDGLNAEKINLISHTLSPIVDYYKTKGNSSFLDDPNLHKLLTVHLELGKKL